MDDSGHGYDVKVSATINASQLQALLTYVKSYPSTYHLNTYNCTDFGIKSMAASGVALSDTNGTWPGGGGSNPGNLGQDIRAMTNGTNTTIKKTSGTALTNTGNCN